MTQEKLNFEHPVASLADEPLPSHLHGKIMKRVFLAGYGKYLYLSAGVLFLNLSVLGSQLWRVFAHPQNLAALKSLFGKFDPSVLTTIMPVESLVATALSTTISAYLTFVFIKLYRDWKSYGAAQSA
ncbi:MAG: hypothetical protein HZA81_02665 [Candidatus Taylorbacteria bacterium]|nr:hypothetical protein [Candidatus Taylorbacteria bacterium]